MSTRQLLEAIHSLDGMGLIVIESDAEIIEEIETLGLADEGGD